MRTAKIDVATNQLIRRLGAAIPLLTAFAGCIPDEDASGHAVVLDQTTQALTSGQIESVNGTYTTCTSRSGSWSIEIASGATLDHSPLSVVLNDTNCVLELTALRTTSGALTATPTITLATSYAGTASSFGAPIAFYANAKVSSLAFADDFVLTIPYSDDPSLGSDSNGADYAITEASATASSVPAPTYTFSASGLSVLVDANNIVDSATGNATLTAGSVTGQFYVMSTSSGLTSYADLDTAYVAGTKVAVTANIAASVFSLVGLDLTTAKVRTLIIANIADGVRSYQAFSITFNKP